MLLFLLAYIGGILTILSPCILPVLPFVFARADQPFRKSGLPLLAGMAVTFAAVASLATVGGGWAVRANQFGRIAALILFALFGLTLLFSSLAERLSRPLVQLGNTLSQKSGSTPSSTELLPPRHRHRPPLGPMRRPYPRTHPHRRSPRRSHLPHRVPPPCLRRRSSHFPRHRTASPAAGSSPP